jgi:hypothetical protein
VPKSRDCRGLSGLSAEIMRLDGVECQNQWDWGGLSGEIMRLDGFEWRNH